MTKNGLELENDSIFFDNNNVNLGHREIELWKGNNTSNAPNAKAGNLYAELNAHTVSTLYQNICVTKDDSFTWSLWHMARSNAASEGGYLLLLQMKLKTRAVLRQLLQRVLTL